MTKGDSRETQMFCCCGSGCGAVADRLRQRSCSRCPEASQSGAAAAVQTAQKERITDQWSLEKTVRGEMIGMMKLSMNTLENNQLEDLCLLLPQQDRLVLRGKYCSETDWGWQQLDVEIPLTSAAPADTPVLTDTYDGVQVQLKGTQGTITLCRTPETAAWDTDYGIRLEQDHTYPILGIYNEYVTIATIESLESVDYDSMEAYADDLYDFCQFGYGPEMDGVLLVSVGDRKWHISTCGYDITAFTDAGIQYLGQQMTPFMADGDYAGAFRTFVQWSDTYIDAARAGHPYDVNNLPREPLSLVYLFLALGIGLVLAWVVVSVMKSQLRSVAFQENAASYVREGSMNLTNSRELFLYRDVHRTERPKESSSSDSGGSSTHTSSSGTTHGGGGGSF